MYNLNNRMKNIFTTKKIFAIMLIFALLFSSMTNSYSLNANRLNKNKPRIKYFFYFIGDGMGIAHSELAQNYLNSIKNTNEKSLIHSLPNSAIYSTNSANSYITDSAAAGTAMASGYKTNNTKIGLSPKGEILETIAEAAAKKGYSIGLATNTSVLDATPAAFLSHNDFRYNANEIAASYLNAKFDYLVGGGAKSFLNEADFNAQLDVAGKPIEYNRDDNRNIAQEFRNKGYIVDVGFKGAQNFKQFRPKINDKYIGLFSNYHMPLNIDIPKYNYNVPSLEAMTFKGLELMYKNPKGFFFMVEGGRIDHASHANDPKATINEVIEFEKAIKVAYDFYKNHPDETLIIITADHETGGLSLGANNDYFLKLETLKNQKISISNFANMSQFYNGKNKEEFLNALEQNFGLKNFSDTEMKKLNAELSKESNINILELKRIIAELVSNRAGISWGTYAHSGVPVACWSIGVGAENFKGYIDNTDIPRIINNILKLDMKFKNSVYFDENPSKNIKPEKNQNLNNSNNDNS